MQDRPTVATSHSAFECVRNGQQRPNVAMIEHIQLAQGVSVENRQDGSIRVSDTRTNFSFDVELEPEAIHEFEVLLNDLGMLSDEGFDSLWKKQKSLRDDVRSSDLEERVTAYAEYCREAVPYYRADPAYAEPAQDLDSFQTFPILTKDCLRRKNSTFFAQSDDAKRKRRNGDVRAVSTSGSTGERLMAITDMSLSRLPPDFAALWGLDPAIEVPKTAVFTTPICSATDCNLSSSPDKPVVDGETLFLTSSHNLFAASEGFVRDTLEQITSFETHILYGNPVYLAVICQLAKRFKIAAPKIDIVLLGYQYATKAQRRIISEFFDAPTNNF